MKKNTARSRRMTWVNLRAGELLDNQHLIKPSWGDAFRGAQAEYEGLIDDAIADSDYVLSRSEAIEHISEAVETEIKWLRDRASQRKAAKKAIAAREAYIAAKWAKEDMERQLDFVKFPTFGCDSSAPENILVNSYDPAEERRAKSRYKMNSR